MLPLFPGYMVSPDILLSVPGTASKPKLHIGRIEIKAIQLVIQTGIFRIGTLGAPFIEFHSSMLDRIIKIYLRYPFDIKGFS
jgi:hypothetical protein